MSTTTTSKKCNVDLTGVFGSSVSDQQVLLMEGNKICLRIPSSVKYGAGTFTNLIHFTITLKKEAN